MQTANNNNFSMGELFKLMHKDTKSESDQSAPVSVDNSNVVSESLQDRVVVKKDLVDKSATENIAVQENLVQAKISPEEDLKQKMERIELESVYDEQIREYNRLTREITKLSDEIKELGEKNKISQEEIVSLLNRDDYQTPGLGARVRERILAEIRSEIVEKQSSIDGDKKKFNESVMELEGKKELQREIRARCVATLLNILDTFKFSTVEKASQLLKDVDKLSRNSQKRVAEEKLNHELTNLCTRKRYEINRQSKAVSKENRGESLNELVAGSEKFDLGGQEVEAVEISQIENNNVIVDSQNIIEQEPEAKAEQQFKIESNDSTSKETTKPAHFVDWEVILPQGEVREDQATHQEVELNPAAEQSLSSAEIADLQKPTEATPGHRIISEIKQRLSGNSSENSAGDNSTNLNNSTENGQANVLPATEQTVEGSLGPKQTEVEVQGEVKRESPTKQSVKTEKIESSTETSQVVDNSLPQKATEEMHFGSMPELEHPGFLPRLYKQFLGTLSTRKVNQLEKSLIGAREKTIDQLKN